MQKLPVPFISLGVQDQGAVFQEKMNTLATACKTTVEAYNNQIDAAATAKQYSAAAQQALADADVTPILQRLGMITQSTPLIFMDFCNASYMRYIAGIGLTPCQLSDIMTTSRSTIGSAQSLIGRQQVAANLPRFDYDVNTKACLGLLTERAATNYSIKSDDFTLSPWVTSAAIVTLDAALTADAAEPVYQVVGAHDLGFNGSNLRCILSIPADTICTYEIDIMPQPGCDSISLRSNSDAQGLSTSTYVTPVIPGVWQRVRAPAARSTGTVTITISSANAEQPGAPFFAKAFDIQPGTTATSHITTDTNALSRSVEAHLVEHQLSEIRGTLFCSFVAPQYVDFNTFIGIGSANSEEIRVGYSTDRRILLTLRSGPTQPSVVWPDESEVGSVVKLAFSWERQEDGTFLISSAKNGVQGNTVKMNSLPVGFASALAIGVRRHNSFSLAANGCIRSLVAYRAAVGQNAIVEMTR